MKGTPFLLFAMLFHLAGTAQLPAPFENLPSTDFQTELFWPASMAKGTPPNGLNEIPILTRNEQRQLLFSFEKADFTNAFFQTMIALDEAGKTVKQSSTSIPLILADIDYTTFSETAFSSGMIVAGEEAYSDESGEGNPYVVQGAFFGYIDLLDHNGGDYLFTLPPSNYISNRTESLTNIQIDPDDGFGYRSFNVGETIGVSYNDDMSAKTIRIKGERNGEEFTTFLELKSAGGASSFPNPELPPWSYNNPAFPWQFSSEAEGEVMRGNAYTLMSDDGIFDRPFVFVEGIDFGQEINVLRNGQFGWYEFTSGASINYPFLANMPVLLDDLRARGFDLILLDFEDGAASISQNSQLLIDLIERINEHRTGAYETVIAGASMGGQICRMALAKMEKQGIPHCSSHYISLDSPHAGANLPFGLQHALYYANEFNQGAQAFVQYYLERPATRELLIAHVLGNEPHEAYLSELNDLGFPAYTRNLAIANGSGSAELLDINSGSSLLDYECTFLGESLFKMRIVAAPGDAYHDLASPTHNVIFEGEYSSIVECGNDLFCIIGGLFSNNGFSAVAQVSNNLPHIDNAPGGTRNSMKQLVDELNVELATLEEHEIINCDSYISPDEYETLHCFIPSTSALGLTTGAYYLHVDDHLDSYPDECPFDNWLSHSYNSQHSEITWETIEFILNELDQTNGLEGPSLDASDINNGSFNLAGDLYPVIPNLIVQDGGLLHINGDQPLGFGEDEDAISENPSHFNARLTGCGNELNIHQGGALEIGSSLSNRTARLVAPHSATMSCTNGTIVLNTNSTLQLDRSSQLILDGGTFEMLPGSRLIIKEGANLLFNAMTIFKVHEGATIEIEGEIRIAEELTAEIRMVGDDNGVLLFRNPGLSIHGAHSSELIISGTHAAQELIIIEDGGSMRTNWTLGALTIKEGIINLESNTLITSNAYLSLDQVRMQAVDNSHHIWLSDGAHLSDCTMHKLEIACTYETDLLRIVDSKATETTIEVHGGGYRLFGCEMINSHVFSDNLGLTVHILETTFEGNSNGNGITDISDVTLFARESVFDNYDTAIQKEGGEVRLKCTEFTQNNIAVEVFPYTELNLSTDLGAGFNVFSNNDIHIKMTAAASFDLLNGHNQFGTASAVLFEGSVLGDCNEECKAKSFVHRNGWPNGGNILSYHYDIQQIDVECDYATPIIMFDGCDLKLVDKNPISTVSCGLNDPIKPGKVETVKSNSSNYPLIFSEHFDGVSILDALHVAMGFMSYYGENPDEELAVTLLSELIIYDHDLSDPLVQRVKNAARKNLLISSTVLLERDIVQFDAEQDVLFPLTLDLTKQAMNKLTASSINLPNYRQQFLNEIDKVRFALSSLRYDDAMDILESSDACGLDAIEQSCVLEHVSRLDNHLARLAFTELYYETDSVFELPPEFPLDQPEAWLPETASFGAHIQAPGDITYPFCGEAPFEKSTSKRPVFRISPNPASDSFYLNNDQLDGQTVISVFDTQGRCCLERHHFFDGFERYYVNTASLAPGVYVVMADDGQHKWHERLIIR